MASTSFGPEKLRQSFQRTAANRTQLEQGPESSAGLFVIEKTGSVAELLNGCGADGENHHNVTRGRCVGCRVSQTYQEEGELDFGGEVHVGPDEHRVGDGVL